MSKPLRRIEDLRGYGSAATMEALKQMGVKTLPDLFDFELHDWRKIPNVNRDEAMRILEAKNNA